MAEPHRCQHSCPSSHHLQPHWRHRPDYSNSMICYKPGLMRNSTTFFPLQRYKLNSSPSRPDPSSGRKVRPIRLTPMAPGRHRRSHTSLCPTPFKHDSCRRYFSTYSPSPSNTTQPVNPNNLFMSRRINHPFHSHLRSNSK